MEGILSQDEVDALLDGGSGDASADETPAQETGARPYDLATQERIVRGRMPTLEIIHERFARNLRIGMFNFMRRTPELSVGPVRTLKYSAFMHDLILPTNLNLVALKPLRGTGLIVFEPTLVFAVIDCMFGGSGKIHTRIEGREFTITEMRIIQRMLEMTLGEYIKAWAPVHKLELEYVRSEMHPQFANIVPPSDVVVAAKFDLDFGDCGGAIHLCIPYASVEPIRDALFSSTQTDTGEADRRWLSMLSSQVQTAEVELIANLAEIDATIRQVLNMRPGDVLAFQPPETVQVNVHGVPVLEGRPGIVKGNYAIQVARLIAGDHDEEKDHAVRR